MYAANLTESRHTEPSVIQHTNWLGIEYAMLLKVTCWWNRSELLQFVVPSGLNLIANVKIHRGIRGRARKNVGDLFGNGAVNTIYPSGVLPSSRPDWFAMRRFYIGPFWSVQDLQFLISYRSLALLHLSPSTPITYSWFDRSVRSQSGVVLRSSSWPSTNKLVHKTF